MTSKRLWDFNDFWTIPPIRILRRNLKKTRGLFRELPHKEAHAIEVLYDILKNIEVVSVVLRFIDPYNYGIISPPVRYTIRQGPGKNYVDEYLEFLRILRHYKEAYEISRIADVDIALWILSQKCILPGTSGCANYLAYKEMIVRLDEEIIKKSQAFREMEENLLSIYLEEERAQDKKLKKQHLEIENELLSSFAEKEKQREDESRRRAEDIIKHESALEREIKELRLKRAMYPENLIHLADSKLHPKSKLIHDQKEGPVDLGQLHFMAKLTGISIVNKVIWSENTTSRPRTRISHIASNGEMTILYVNKDCYAAKIKTYPVTCPDLTHAKYFAFHVAKVMDIPIDDVSLIEN